MNGSYLAIGAAAALAAVGALSRRGSRSQGMLVFDNQRLRNLTSPDWIELHTAEDDLYHYEDLGLIVGVGPKWLEKFPPQAFEPMRKAVRPWLLSQVLDGRFWNNELDHDHVGTTQLRAPTQAEREEMWRRYEADVDQIWRRANQEGSAGEDHDLRRRLWKSMMMGGDL
jgi:hypothetical protein